MRFAALGSGSRGNAVLVEAGDGRCLLVDDGFSVSETERRLARLGVAPERLVGILVSHEHTDHLGGAARFARRHGLPLALTAGTARALGEASGLELRTLSGDSACALGPFEILPFPVPHDAAEPVAFRIGDGACSLGILTDLGEATPHVLRMLARCAALYLECNHDAAMLAGGPYPPPLKARVASRVGHLSNRQAAAILQQLRWEGLRHVVAAHLSETNNRPERVAAALAPVLGCRPGEVDMADQDHGLGWRALL